MRRAFRFLPNYHYWRKQLIRRNFGTDAYSRQNELNRDRHSKVSISLPDRRWQNIGIFFFQYVSIATQAQWPKWMDKAVSTQKLLSKIHTRDRQKFPLDANAVFPKHRKTFSQCFTVTVRFYFMFYQ